MNSGDPALAGGWAPPQLSGDPQSIWMLWQHNRRHVEKVLRASFRLSQWDLEEVMSITMLKFYEQFPRHCANIRNLSSWLARLAQNATTDYLRKEKRRQQRHQSLNEQGSCIGSMEVAPARSYAPEREAGEAVDAIMVGSGLSGILRETAIAHFLQGKNYSEIALAQHVKIVTIRKRIQSIRKYIRNELQKEQQQSVCPTAISEFQFDFTSSRVLAGPGKYGDRFAHVFFRRSPIRFEQRAETLRGYLNRRQPREPVKWLELAELHLAARGWEEARDTYEACHRKYPSLLEAGWRAAQLHLLLDNKARALQLCAEMMTSPGSATRSDLLHGYRAWIEGRFQEVPAAWERAALLEPENADHQVRLFHSFMKEGRTSEARNSLKRALVVSPHHYRATNLLLPLLHAAGEHELLQTYIGALYAVGDRNAVVLKYYADLRLTRGDCSRQESDALRHQVAQALEIAPRFPGLLDTLAYQLDSMDRPPKLLKFLDAIIQEHTDAAGAWKVRAIWLGLLGNQHEAVSSARMAFSLAPQAPAVLSTMAWLAAHFQRMELLAEILDALLLAGSIEPRLWLAAALAATSAGGNPGYALELSRMASEKGDVDPFIAYGYGHVLAQAGHGREALDVYQRAWEMVLPIKGHILGPHLAYQICAMRKRAEENQEPCTLPRPLSFPAKSRGLQSNHPLLLSDLMLFFARCVDEQPTITVPL